jgi:YrbI family 3-deoxy-D-manno-octulosonate 8-phosphate phosphatase
MTPSLGPAALEAVILGVRLVVFDFDGVFTDNTVYVTQDGAETVRCWRSDGLGLRRLERAGLEAMILSTETNPVVSARARKLAVACRQGLSDKAAVLRGEIDRRGLSPGQVAYLGNDVNDLACLRLVGLPAAVADAHADILDAVRYRTRVAGGFGAVREFCDLIASAHERASVRT